MSNYYGSSVQGSFGTQSLDAPTKHSYYEATTSAIHANKSTDVEPVTHRVQQKHSFGAKQSVTFLASHNAATVLDKNGNTCGLVTFKLDGRENLLGQLQFLTEDAITGGHWFVMDVWTSYNDQWDPTFTFPGQQFVTRCLCPIGFAPNLATAYSALDGQNCYLFNYVHILLYKIAIDNPALSTGSLFNGTDAGWIPSTYAFVTLSYHPRSYISSLKDMKVL